MVCREACDLLELHKDAVLGVVRSSPALYRALRRSLKTQARLRLERDALADDERPPSPPLQDHRHRHHHHNRHHHHQKDYEGRLGLSGHSDVIPCKASDERTAARPADPPAERPRRRATARSISPTRAAEAGRPMPVAVPLSGPVLARPGSAELPRDHHRVPARPHSAVAELPHELDDGIRRAWSEASPVVEARRATSSGHGQPRGMSPERPAAAKAAPTPARGEEAAAAVRRDGSAEPHASAFPAGRGGAAPARPGRGLEETATAAGARLGPAACRTGADACTPPSKPARAAVEAARTPGPIANPRRVAVDPHTPAPAKGDEERAPAQQRPAADVRRAGSDPRTSAPTAGGEGRTPAQHRPAAADPQRTGSDPRTPAAAAGSGPARAGSSTPAASDEAVGARFFYADVQPETHWRVLKAIGRGSSGVVYAAQARDPATAERWPEVALKKVGRRLAAVQSQPSASTALNGGLVWDMRM